MKDVNLLLATRDGVVVAAPGGNGWQVVRSGLAGRHVSSVIGRQGVVLAGTNDGIYRSDDLGQNWFEVSAGLEQRHVRWLAYHPEISDFELAGAEPAAIFVSRDGGERWRACPEVTALRRQHGWWLPYSPEAGCVRGFAHHGDRAYAAVEVGGVLRSEDGGESWRLTGEREPGAIHADVHSILTHPASPDLVLAPTGGGLYRSGDGGETWELLYRCYCRAAWWDAGDPDHIVFGPASGVDRGGRVEFSRDGGRTWQNAAQDMDTPWPRTMLERLVEVDGDLAAVRSDGAVLAASLPHPMGWRRLLPEIAAVQAIALMAD